MYIRGFVFLPIIVTAGPHPPHLCILTPITVINQSVYLLLQFSQLQILLQLLPGSTASFERVRGGGQAPWLCFSACSDGCQTTAAAPVCSVSAPVTGFSSSMYLPLRQGCALYLSVLQVFREHTLQADFSLLLRPRLSSRLCLWHPSLLFSMPPPVCSALPTFRCFSAQITQMYLCVEQGILC